MGHKLIKIFLVLSLIMLAVTMTLLRGASERENVSQSPGAKPRKNFLKIVHIDLKGAPPKMSFLSSLLPVVRRAGANALLIEYEDTFPFAGSLANISSKSPYTLRQIERFVADAESHGMEVIPLVQTFGHLEFVLKLEEFRHLRETDDYPMEICPSRNEAAVLVKEMIRQVMVVHKRAKYIHIGCDEVRHLGKCPACSRTRPRKLFTRHVYRIGSYVRATYPGVIPLMWDDMMRRWSISDIQDSGLASAVEPVVWVYGEDIPHLVPHYLWYIYFKTFPRVWAASAFKGATGETEVVPGLGKLFENNLSWARFIKNRKDRADASPDIFGGIIITGWSRYDHFGALCELLPSGIPSLLLNLILADKNFDIPDSPVASDRVIFRKWIETLGCPGNFPEANRFAIQSRQFQSLIGNCDFPGSTVYKLAFEYLNLRERLEGIVRGIENSAWASPYNAKYNYTNPWRINEMLNHPELKDLLFKSIGMFKSSFRDAANDIYENFVVKEWFEQKIAPIEEKINSVYRELKKMTLRRTWQRRPLQRTRQNGD